ncbi:YhfT family protein [Virgibacillus sp. 179-BFC.A HS]|uniref:Phosphohexomutase n=1 Tax=Tigheibacillus jepli TaxID=3035914 RepID=A0ABU5CK49_9BACI|nr:YhfT family protein [Virgibacillus sp. 179-BFC.A HS]MDY0406713.1 YhfT family protein [Virgibacillus sp. 179-BFC.A HS]
MAGPSFAAPSPMGIPESIPFSRTVTLRISHIFFPLVASTAIATGVYSPVGFTLIFVVELFVPNLWLAVIKLELHLERAKEVTNVPQKSVNPERVKEVYEGLTREQMLKATYFTVYHWLLNGSVNMQMDADFLQVSVINGSGEIRVDGKSFPIEKVFISSFLMG